MYSVALLNIGSELLQGRTVNTNAADIGIMLGNAGYSVDHTEVIHDVYDTIKNAMLNLMDRFDIVLVTGGLGPTKDDITKKVLLDIFGGELVLNQPMLDQIKEFYRQMNREMNNLNVLQAQVPSSCEVLHNSRGTAPGMWFERDGKVLVSMPGVPFEMKHLVSKRVIPKLREKFPAEMLLSRIVRTNGIPESKLAERMEEIENQISAKIEIAYLPSLDGTKVVLKRRGPEAEKASIEQELEAAQKLTAAHIAKYVYALEDKLPDKLLAEYLLRKNLTFGTAESCTGGMISSKMVQNSGVSQVHTGGIVAYMVQTKENVLDVAPEIIEQNGVVSEATAIAMAEGARNVLNCDIAISITGIAEGDFYGPPEETPQAWIGYADRFGSEARHMRFFQGRNTNIERATYAALIFALKMVRQNFGE